MATVKKSSSKIHTALLYAVEEKPHFHQELEILYIIRGGLTVVQDNSTFQLQKDDVVVINCNNVHSLQGSEDLSLLQIQISYDLLLEVSGGAGMVFACNSSVDAYHPYGELRRIMRQLLFSYAGARKKTEALRYSYVYELLDILTEQFQVQLDSQNASRPQREEARLQAIINYVNQNFREEINLSKLAEQMYLSTSSLSRLFKKSMGCYFGDFVNHVRLNHAVKELEETDKTVTRIAADCGFANLAAFNKQFQNAYQMAPSAYRQLAWEKQEADDEQNLAVLEQGARMLHKEADRESLGRREQSISVTVQAGQGTVCQSPCNQVLNGGAAADLTIYNVQEHLTSLYENLKFRYVRVWNVFSKKMVILQDPSGCQYNFDMLDNVFDFMSAHHMIPYLDLGQRPFCAVKSEGQMVYYEDEELVFENANDWLRMFMAFVEHAIRRYGRQAVGEWIFDFTLDIRFEVMPFCSDEDEMWELYRRLYAFLRQNLPNVKVGGLGGVPVSKMEMTIRWLQYCKKHNCVPDHLSVLIFPYMHEFQNGDFVPRRTAREDEEIQQICRCREILDQNGLQDCRLFVVEWNNSLSTRSWLNDSCFRAAYALEVINRTWGVADVMALWMATDWCCSYYDTMHVASGGNGLVSKNGIRKPIYHALDFLNRMNARFLQRGDHYIATTNGPDFYILCYNFKRYSYQFYHEEENEFDLHCLSDLFVDDCDLQIHFTLTGLDEKAQYAIKRRTVNREHGSLLGEWSRFEFDTSLDARDVQYLRNKCNPDLSMRKQRTEKGVLEFNTVLQAHEITLFHIFKLHT